MRVFPTFSSIQRLSSDLVRAVRQARWARQERRSWLDGGQLDAGGVRRMAGRPCDVSMSSALLQCVGHIPGPSLSLGVTHLVTAVGISFLPFCHISCIAHSGMRLLV